MTAQMSAASSEHFYFLLPADPTAAFRDTYGEYHPENTDDVCAVAAVYHLCFTCIEAAITQKHVLWSVYITEMIWLNVKVNLDTFRTKKKERKKLAPLAQFSLSHHVVKTTASSMFYSSIHS